jgi:hypothetical protein
MFTGSVRFGARIKGNGLSFPMAAFNPNEAGVDKVEIEAANGSEIVTTVYLSSVASREEGRALATRVNTAALDRIGFVHGVAIENAQMTGNQLTLLNPPPGVLEAAPGEIMIVGAEARLVVWISADRVRAELEQAAPPGEGAYGLLRSARLSMSPVEEFMHLYNLLLMMFNDKQADVDAFIVGEEPAVPRTQRPTSRQA